MNRDSFAGPGLTRRRPTPRSFWCIRTCSWQARWTVRSAVYFEQAQSAIDQAVDVEIEEAYDTGNLLFSDPRGIPLALYGTSRFNNRKPGGPSWGSETAPALEPDKLVGKLESSAIGCFWMLGVLEELLENAQKHFWAAGDRLRMIRLLGRNPVDGIADRRVAEVFAASHAIRPVGKPFDDLQSDMSESVLEAHVQTIKVKWRDLSRKDESEKARQSLIDMVRGRDRADPGACRGARTACRGGCCTDTGAQGVSE